MCEGKRDRSGRKEKVSTKLKCSDLIIGKAEAYSYTNHAAMHGNYVASQHEWRMLPEPYETR